MEATEAMMEAAAVAVWERAGYKFSKASARHVVEAVFSVIPAQSWQDISTAPKDGTQILVCHKTKRDVKGMQTARWGKDNWLNDLGLCIENPYMRFADILDRTITHWQALPSLPDQIIADHQGGEK